MKYYEIVIMFYTEENCPDYTIHICLRTIGELELDRQELKDMFIEMKVENLHNVDNFSIHSVEEITEEEAKEFEECELLYVLF